MRMVRHSSPVFSQVMVHHLAPIWHRSQCDPIIRWSFGLIQRINYWYIHLLIIGNVSKSVRKH